LDRRGRKAAKQTAASFVTAGPDPAIRFDFDRNRGELEAEVETVFSGARKIVDDEPVAALNEDHAAAVRYRIGQASVGAMLGVGEIVVFAGAPAA
jgi:hypothetical protein